MDECNATGGLWVRDIASGDDCLMLVPLDYINRVK